MVNASRFRLLRIAAGALPVVLPLSAQADALLVTHRLTTGLAADAARAVVESCAKQGYAETAVVVDADGVPQAVLRGDRAGAHTLNSANDKAYTAASFKTDTGALVERAKTAPGLAALFTQIPHLILFAGGVVVKVNDEVVGAIGAAGAPGGNLDEACARSGLESIQGGLK